MKTEDNSLDMTQTLTKKKIGLILVVGVIALVVLGMCYQGKPKTAPDKVVEDIFTTNALPPVVETPKEVAHPSPEVTEEQMAALQEKKNELQQRLSAPLMMVSNNTANTVAEPRRGPTDAAGDPNTQFKNQISAQAVEVATAGVIGDLNTIIAMGSLIHATLESATNSDLPGYLRASVSEPVYSEDGRQLLIPRGSRLVGQYKNGMLQGQSRIFVVWTRVLTPEGVSVDLGSPGVDSLGVAGIGADEIDRHFWQRFGTASLLSVIGAGASNMGGAGSDTQNPASMYREAVASSFAQSANQSLQQESLVAPTLRTYQGKPIMVFVARDLHFTNSLKQMIPKINVF